MEELIKEINILEWMIVFVNITIWICGLFIVMGLGKIYQEIKKLNVNSDPEGN